MKRRNIGTLLLGVAFLALAVILLGSAAGWWDFSLFFDGWWALFLIVPGVVAMLNDGVNSGNVILTAIGVLLLLNAQHVIRLSWVWFAVLVLAVAGISTILGALGIHTRRRNQNGSGSSFVSASSDSQDFPAYSVLFSGIECANNSQDLQGARISAVFGGAQIDLRSARITHDITIKCEAIFGGVDLFLPSNVRVQLTGTPVFGGHDCSFMGSADPDAPLVTIQCNAVFGGIDIK